MRIQFGDREQDTERQRDREPGKERNRTREESRQTESREVIKTQRNSDKRGEVMESNIICNDGNPLLQAAAGSSRSKVFSWRQGSSGWILLDEGK